MQYFISVENNSQYKQVISLELSTGVPLLYIHKEEKFMRRGSPVGPTEPGVYAYTKVLTLCSSKLLTSSNMQPIVCNLTLYNHSKSAC